MGVQNITASKLESSTSKVVFDICIMASLFYMQSFADNKSLIFQLRRLLAIFATTTARILRLWKLPMRLLRLAQYTRIQLARLSAAI